MRFAIVMVATVLILGTFGRTLFEAAFVMEVEPIATTDTPSHFNDGPYRRTSSKHWVHKRDDSEFSYSNIMDGQRNPYVIDSTKSYPHQH